MKMNIRTLVFGATTAFCLFLSGIPVPGADLEGFSEQGVSVAYQAEENTSQFDASIISGGVIYEGFGHTYTVVNENMGWNEAKELCESLGGHLAVVTSQAETELFKSFELSEERNYWLGARTDESGRFVWINGERWGYENWDEGEKDQEGEEDPEACCLKLSPYGISSEEGCVWIKGKETPQENEKTGFILEWESDWGDITQEIREEKGFQSVYDIPQGLWVTGIDPEGYEYTGDQVVIQGLCVYVGNKRLSADSDYTVRYYNNTDAGEAKLIITGKGNYSGSVEQSFAIVPLSLGNGGLVSENFSAPDITLIYTGRAQYKTTTISYLLGESFIELKNGKDYTLEYSDKYDYCAEGEHTVKVKGIGNYCGDAFFTEYIVSNDKKIIGSMKFSKLPALYATGEALEPELEIKDGDIVLTEGKDYVAEYAYNIYPGRAVVTVTGCGDYYGVKTMSFNINSVPISKARAEGVVNFPYTGEEIRQDQAYLVYEDSILVEHIDYETEYKNNTAASKNKACVIYKGTGRFSGELKKTFSIDVLDLNDVADAYFEESETVRYEKGGAKPQVVVEFDSVELSEGVDYTVRYYNNKSVSTDSAKTPYLIINGKGNFKGSIRLDFNIIPGNLEEADMQVSDVVYAERAGICRPTITLYDKNGARLKAGTDYDKKDIDYCYASDCRVLKKEGKELISQDRAAGDMVDLENDIIPAGTRIIVTVKGKKNYAPYECSSEKSASFRFVNAFISKAKAKIEPKVYQGEAVKLSPSDIVLTYNKETLGSEDFRIIGYRNNASTGTASVTIEGRGDFGGTKTISFKINKYQVDKG